MVKNKLSYVPFIKLEWCVKYSKRKGYKIHNMILL